MADSEIAGLTEDTTPDPTDNIYAQDAAGAVDKRVPLSALPISTATQTALDAKAAAADLTAHTGDTTDAHDASAISVVSTTLVGTGTDVQAVLEELDNAIVADETALANHLADTSAAHAASAVSADSTTLVGTGTDVQAVLEELDNAIVVAETATSNHLADTADAHDASAISVDSTTLVGTGTDVQAVLEELDNAIVADETALANHLADTADAHDASAISILDTANDFTATDVEGALAELQSDHEADATALTDHVNDTSAAHAASAITADSTTLVGTGTTVQAVLEELDNGIADHLADTADAHDASAISVADSGGLYTATDVEAALAEVHDYVDDEIVALDEIAAGVRTDLNTGTPGFVSLDVDLASGKSGGDTLTGGTGSGEDLTLASTTHATRGTVIVRDPMEFLGEDITNTTTTAIVGIDVPSSRTITLADAAGGLNSGNSINALVFRPVVILEENGNLLGTVTLFNALPTLRNASTEVRTSALVAIYNSGITIRGQGAAGSLTVSEYAGFRDAPTVDVASSGTSVVTALAALTADLAVGSGGTVTTRRGVHIKDSSGAGTVTTGIGVDIAALSDATTSIGLRNASTTVHTPSVQTISAAGNTITPNASTKRLNNTSGGSVTLTSTPTISDGQDGQRLLLFNSSAQNVVLQDQGTLASSGLRLSATTITLGTRDSIELMYSSDIGDWIQISQVNVL